MLTYEVFALAYAGPFSRPGPMLKWLSNWDKMQEIFYYFWCLQGGGRTVLVDTGIGPDHPRVPNLDGYKDPVKMLAGLGVTPEAVDQVILTHLHFDHILGANLFPRATFWLQEEELNFWVHNPLAKRPPFAFLRDEPGLAYLDGLRDTDRLRLINGDLEIMPGVELFSTPGHTPGMQAVAVDTEQGKVVLASDCAHLASSLQDDWPSGITINLADALASFDKLRAKASRPELIFAGHDPGMTRDYPLVAPGVTRLA